MNVFVGFSDVVGSMNRVELQELMRLDDIMRQHVNVLDCSAKDGGVGLQNIMTWIQHSLRPSGPSSG